MGENDFKWKPELFDLEFNRKRERLYGSNEAGWKCGSSQQFILLME